MWIPFIFQFITLFLSSVFLVASSEGLDQRINDAFMPFAEAWEQLILSEVPLFGQRIPVVLIILLTGALLFTIYFGFVNIRHFGTALKVVRGDFDTVEKSHAEAEGISSGEVNHFQALTTAVSGTVGLGNIAMVAVAISIGGPGATFWMILAGILGMSSKFVECTLGVAYRDVDANGTVFGGPMYYLSKGLKEIGFSRLGKVLAITFAILCVGASFGGGNAFQSNQAAAQIIERFDITGPAAGTLIGVIFAILSGIVIIGGIKRIAKVTEKVVPFMAILYVGAALFIIFSKIHLIGDVFSEIITDAFTPKATIVGGFIGVMIQGFRRAAFSNEAGAGSAAIAHSAVQTQFPASEGLVGLLEPFIDTVVVCTITAIVIVLFNQEGAFVYGDVINGQVLMSDGSRLGGVNITSLAFENSITGASYLLVVAVCLFAFSTILSWSYYGLQSWQYLFGRGKFSGLTYKIFFHCFSVMGGAITLDEVFKFSDAMILALVFPNMIGLFFLFPKVKVEFKRYLKLIS